LTLPEALGIEATARVDQRRAAVEVRPAAVYVRDKNRAWILARIKNA
jgi:hypothetical protein